MTEIQPLELNSIDREYIFLHFAFSECIRAKSALDEVVRLAAIKEVDEARGITVLEWVPIFDSIRMALHFAGSVSRMFFPPKSTEKFASERAKKRGARLRQLTGLSATHPIGNRTLRNHVEHMDERMDEWTSISPRPFAGAVEMTIEDDTFQITRDAVEASCPFIYYRDRQTVRAFGDEFDLAALRATLDDVTDHLVRGLKAYRDEKLMQESPLRE